jgi:hypothetical protein
MAGPLKKGTGDVVFPLPPVNWGKAELRINGAY